MKRLTCRYCGKALYERKPLNPEGISHFYRASWFSHEPDTGTNAQDDDKRACSDGKRGVPKEICNWIKESDGQRCNNPVKHEDIQGELYACGVHMKHFVEEKERSEAQEAAQRRRNEEEAISQWELGIYQAAYDRLTERFPEMFPVRYRPEKRGWRGWDRTIEIDIVDLEKELSREPDHQSE